ncbi:DUF5686 and carboxypeptidase regulatory-like domain-containing protein [Lewinella sp. IMCC34191]|uniref:DUF5686 and carboxypeptidase regulatory-like domain-containing protein n=1 Tax=Lewinella sp. IMCC34191 TaxID=2259172 RepID=UPI000E23B8C9|nr:DUF5686 and carboxypeptidase regulatory-like domain-containing protein [Lewinella sp. IMCC34191]
MTALRLLLFCLLATLASVVAAQSVQGVVRNEYDEPVPFANVYVRQTNSGTVTDDAGRYTLNFRVDGEYEITFSSLGYETRSVQLVVGMEDQTYDLRLQTSGVELDEITVSASGRDPAYAIIKEMIARKEAHQRAISRYRTDVYVKAVEEVEDHYAPKDLPVESDPSSTPPFISEEKSSQQLLSRLNMVEMRLELSYAFPRSYRETRLGYERYGDTRGLFLPVFAETDFNFYRNLVALPGVSLTPVISPLSQTSVLTYAFELLDSDVNGDQVVYRIKVTPRKVGNSTVSGTLYVNAEDYTINRLEFDLPAGALLVADEFNIRQRYDRTDDGRWYIGEQVFNYHTRQGKKKDLRGSTTLSYTNFQPDVDFPDDFFGNEVASITAEAYERDSSYWQSGRTVALTEDERQMVHLRDSVKAVVTSPAYRDSMERLYNRITLLELALDGIGFQNYRKERQWYVAPVTSLVDLSPVVGWRVGPYVSTFKRFPSGKELSLSGSLNLGLRNMDIQGKVFAWHRYDPFELGDISLWLGREFEAFYPNDAFLNQLKASNYYLKDKIDFGTHRELANGLYLNVHASLADRRPITAYETGSILDEVITDEDTPVDFERYQAFVTDISLRYTPSQRYMREPRRKVVLGSDWPTFGLLYRRGWADALSSDIRFDYLQLSVDQQFGVGALGQSSYRIVAGGFTNTEDLRFVDIRRFRQSDPLLLSDPLSTFQALNTSLATSGPHLEFHYLHHFSGALINNVPLLKKTRIQAVAGAGALFLKDDSYRYQELLAGMERVFKVGARRRLRVGLYGIAADDNQSGQEVTYKVSFDLIDIWRKDFRF